MMKIRFRLILSTRVTVVKQSKLNTRKRRFCTVHHRFYFFDIRTTKKSYILKQHELFPYLWYQKIKNDVAHTMTCYDLILTYIFWVVGLQSYSGGSCSRETVFTILYAFIIVYKTDETTANSDVMGVVIFLL